MSTRAAVGRLSLTPCSFCRAFAGSPRVIGFSSEGRKDTLRNVELAPWPQRSMRPDAAQPEGFGARKCPAGTRTKSQLSAWQDTRT